mmetsp:Transcript_117664/g.293344  ORF Transcript_117664/g.293344 Transcript_117664/m.293344 type:complete len:312 (+) Transcript_117664:115-1050(+)
MPFLKHHVAKCIPLEVAGVSARISRREYALQAPTAQFLIACIEDNVPSCLVERRDRSSGAHRCQFFGTLCVTSHRGGRTANRQALLIGLQPDERERVSDKLGFDPFVQGRVGAQGRVNVHLQQPRQQGVVDQHVETVDLEGAGAEVLPLSLPVNANRARLSNRGLHGDQSFYDQVGDAVEKPIVVQVMLLQVRTQFLEGPFRRMTNSARGRFTASFPVTVGHESRRILVDGIIGEVHCPCAQSFRIGLVLFRGKTHQTLFVEVYLQWVERCDNNIDSKIKFVAINKKRIRYVGLNDSTLLAKLFRPALILH